MTWHAKATGQYANLSTEACENAQEICAILINDYGWTLEAAAGAIGNMYKEVQLNPWRWESDHLLTKQQAIDGYVPSGWRYSPGYGLIGWTPARKYQINNASTSGGIIWFPNYDQESYPGYGPNWSDITGSVMDGAAQVKLLAEAMSRGSGNIWVHRQGHLSASQYIQINTTPEYAASEFWYGAEYSQSSESIPERQRYARDYYDWLVEHGWQPSSSGIFPILLTILAKKANEWQLKL